MNEIERKVWELHDSRLNDHEKRFEKSERSFQEIEDQLKYMIGRIDNGISPSVNAIKTDNTELRVILRDIDHKIEIHNIKLTDKIDSVNNTLIDRIEPLETSNKNRDKIYVWAIVGGFVLGLVGFGTSKIMEKIWPKDNQTIAERVGALQSIPVKKR